ncbi:MAG: hypothetical protein EXS14_01240 [Planctomycetes bacterium]|nr:hypothetical protein [Planctomycetota bacterium]
MRLSLACALLCMDLVAQDAVPLETLRETGSAKVAAMRTAFENELDLALRVWAEAPAGDESPALKKTNTSMALWVAGFPQQLLEALCKQSNPLLRQRLLTLLCDSASPELLLPARALLNVTQPWSRAVGISILGSIGGPEDGQKLASMIGATPEPPVEDVIRLLQALTDMKAPESSSCARARVTHAKPEVRLAALQALAALHTAPREELPILAHAVQEDVDMTVRVGALRALSNYGDHLDALKVLHEHVHGVDLQLATAALDALERSANKDTSRSYLMEALGGGGALVFKERCARLLARLGDARGARLLTKTARDAAVAAPRDPDFQIAAGEQLKRLGALMDAIEYYKKALDLLKAGQKYRARVPWARALALLGRFEDAWDQLKPDYRNLAGFADDPDFTEMRRTARWAPLFNSEN